MRALACAPAAALLLAAIPAAAGVIQVSPADGPNAYTKIEAAVAGDEVVIAPGTYAFRVYLTAQGTPSQPIWIHAQDPANPPVVDFGSTLVEDAPGSYTAGDKNRGCWQLSGATNVVIESIVFKNCHTAKGYDSAGIRYYSGTTGLVIKDCLFQSNDNGLTGGTEGSDATVEFSEFASNGNLMASMSAPSHNAYIYGGTFAMRYSYLHDPIQGQNLHCRAVASTIEYNWFDRAKSYVGDLMTSDDYANNPMGSLTQTMTLRGNVIIQGAGQANTSQLWAIFNDEASGSPVSFSVTALYNTVVGAGGHAAFLHVSNADGTQMTVQASNNVVSGTSQPLLVEDKANATLGGDHNWVQTGADLTGLSASITGGSPGFADPANDDFTLAAGSACVGAADTSVAGLPTDEYFQNEVVTREYRPRATANDVGAFEHTTVGPGIGPYGGSGGGGGASTTSSSAAASSGAAGGPASSSAGAGGAPGSGGAPGTAGASSGGETAGSGGSASSKPGGCKCATVGAEGPSGLPCLLGLAALAACRARGARRSPRRAG